MSKIIFTDFFGVVIHDSGNEWLHSHHIFEHKNEYFPLGDIGKLSEKEVMEKTAELSGVPYEQVCQEFEDLATLNQKTVDAYKELKKTCKIIVLSNCYEKALERRVARYHLEDLFDGMIISYQIGMIKPYKEIYEYAYSKFAKEGDEIYYIDDQEINLKAPKELGWNVIHFTDDLDIVDCFNNN